MFQIKSYVLMTHTHMYTCFLYSKLFWETW